MIQFKYRFFLFLYTRISKNHNFAIKIYAASSNLNSRKSCNCMFDHRNEKPGYITNHVSSDLIDWSIINYLLLTRMQQRYRFIYKLKEKRFIYPLPRNTNIRKSPLLKIKRLLIDASLNVFMLTSSIVCWSNPK
jgi:hypothetical protein